jgi:16S rRNA (guanine1207-N2)-methyltransferase
VSDVSALQIEADAADRLILDEAAALVSGNDIVVLGDESGALALGAVAAGATDVRVYSDTANPAGRVARSSERIETPDGDLAGGVSIRELVPRALLDQRETLDGARVVLLRLPKSLDALDDFARRIAAHASPDVVVVAGGRLKYMTVGMNDVLRRSFGRLDVSLARQKSRVLIARSPLAVEPPQPRRAFQPDIDLWVGATGGVFAGTSLDIGTRAMLAAFDKLPAYETAIDLGCGTGILAAQLKRVRPGARVIASDASAAAVASARETMTANELDVEVVHEVGLGTQPDASADLIVLNPPFHDGGAVTSDIALELFAAAARVLRPGGELWTVWNSHLAYKPALARLVGQTREVSRNAKFTVTASIASGPSSPIGPGNKE